MAIFPDLILEDVVQVNDKTRFIASLSFITPGEAAITKTEISPDNVTFFDVTNSNPKNWLLDYEYAADGTFTPAVRITTDGAPITKVFSIDVLTVADDKLFSTDADIRNFEHDIQKRLPPSHNTFNYVHRQSQTNIIRWLNDKGYRKQSGISPSINLEEITKDNVINVGEMLLWSSYMTLWIIFNDLSNLVGDEFDQQATHYRGLMQSARDKSITNLDLNSDGVLDGTDLQQFNSILVHR